MIFFNYLFVFIVVFNVFSCVNNITQKAKDNHETTTAWYERFSDVILTSNKRDHVYQLKTLKQLQDECTMHAERNLLFAMAMFQNNEKNFMHYYQQMTNSDLYEKYAGLVPCSLPHLRGHRRYPEVLDLIKNNPQWEEVLPAESNLWVNEIIKFDFKSVTLSLFKNDNFITLKENKEIIKAIKNILNNSEEKNLSKNTIDDLIYLISQSNISLKQSFTLIKKLHQFNNGTIKMLPFSLGTLISSNFGHQIALLIHKNDGEINYIILDPYNYNFTHHESYLKIIKFFTDFIGNNNNLEKNTIRMVFILNSVINNNIEDAAVLFERNINFLEELNLLNNKFFIENYRKSFCDLLSLYKLDKQKTVKDILSQKLECR
jgi:hypothetical protein